MKRPMAEKVVASFLGLMGDMKKHDQEVAESEESFGFCDQCDARVSRHELHHYSASSLADECDVCSECVTKASY